MDLTRQATALVQVYLQPGAGTVDGLMGPKTREAIEEWQAQTDREPTGELTPREFADLTGASATGGGDIDYSCLSWVDNWFNAEPVSGELIPYGIVIHHTGADTDRANIPAERMINGREGLSGPIVQFGISRNGTCDCYTNGRAHHAGSGSGAVLAAVKADEGRPAPQEDDTSGNTYFLGIEVDHTGREDEPLGEHWEDAVALCAELCGLWKWDPRTRIIGHSEWTFRKTDPIYDMGRFRAEVTERLNHKGGEDYAVVSGRRYRLVPDDEEDS